MAERVEMSFKNKEVKMWFVIMIPVLIIGTIALFLNYPSPHSNQFIVLFLGLVTYYSWRYRYRKKKKEAGDKR